jgi:hypothetical protein
MISERGSRPERIRVSVTCLAEFATNYGRPAESVLRPFKFNKRGEGFARSRYYRHALVAIRKYHEHTNDPEVLDTALAELHAMSQKSTVSRERARLERNIRAIRAYRSIYKDRHFRVLPNHRIAYRIGQLEVTAQPDLWVEENGTQVMLKIGVSKKQPSYVDIILTVMRKAAVSSHYNVRARNIVYLDVLTGQETICKAGLVRFNRTFQARARQIVDAWSRMKPERSSAGEGSGK